MTLFFARLPAELRNGNARFESDMEYQLVYENMEGGELEDWIAKTEVFFLLILNRT